MLKTLSILLSLQVIAYFGNRNVIERNVNYNKTTDYSQLITRITSGCHDAGEKEASIVFDAETGKIKSATCRTRPLHNVPDRSR